MFENCARVTDLARSDAIRQVHSDHVEDTYIGRFFIIQFDSPCLSNSILDRTSPEASPKRPTAPQGSPQRGRYLVYVYGFYPPDIWRTSGLYGK